MISLSKPFNNAVYQRNWAGLGVVPIAGTAAPFETVTAQITLANGGPDVSVTLSADQNGAFSGQLTVPAGWYVLTVQDVTRNVGVGDVFAVFGHSFMTDSPGPATTEKRAVATLDTLQNKAYQYAQITDVLGPFNRVNIGCWGRFADLYVRAQNVPVLIYGAGFGGSNITGSWAVLNGVPFQHPFIDYSQRMPFRPLEVIMSDYAPQTGLRALFVEHGYNDRDLNTSEFFDKFSYVLNYVRNTFRKPELAVFLVQEELTQQFGISAPHIALAQQRLIREVPNIYPGPDFNGPAWTSALRNASDHLNAAGLEQFAQDWNTTVAANLERAKPYLPDGLTPDETNGTLAVFAPETPQYTTTGILVIVGLIILILLFIAYYASQ